MDYMTDLAGLMGSSRTQTTDVKHSTNKDAGKSLDMNDFLTLMVAMFQNQDIDNTASTSEMMNQMVQMSVVQAITNISTLINDSTSLTYAASLVGKEVTIGQYKGGKLEEILGTVTGTGTLNGQQVVFIGNDSYYLSDIMAIGRLPELPEDTVPDDGKPEGGESGGGAETTP